MNEPFHRRRKRNHTAPSLSSLSPWRFPWCSPRPHQPRDRGLALTAPGTVPPRVLGTYHALIVGINDYENWNPLQTAVKDATAVRDVLVNQYGFDEKNVILRTDRDAARLHIIRDLRTLASGLTEKDNLLIYFAGHGQLDDLTGDGYWIPVEGQLKDPGTWISHAVLKAVLGSDKVRAKNVVVIADSCYSGTLLRGGPSLLRTEDGSYLDKLTQAAAKRSRQVITSGGLEPVADGGRDGHSLFAYYVITALEDNDREVVDLENLFHTWVWAPVTQVGDQRPNVGRLKTPMDEDGQFVLRNQGLIERKAVRAAETERAREEQEVRLRGGGGGAEAAGRGAGPPGGGAKAARGETQAPRREEKAGGRTPEARAGEAATGLEGRAPKAGAGEGAARDRGRRGTGPHPKWRPCPRPPRYSALQQASPRSPRCRGTIQAWTIVGHQVVNGSTLFANSTDFCSQICFQLPTWATLEPMASIILGYPCTFSSLTTKTVCFRGGQRRWLKR